MKKIFIVLIIAISFTSCISSLQPLVSLDKVTTDNRITGKWSHDGDTYSIAPVNKTALAKEMNKEHFGIWEDQVTDSLMRNKMYVVEFASEGVTYYLLAALVKLNGQTFANLYPGIMNDAKRNEEQRDPYFLNADYLPGFTVAKIDINENSLTLKFIDGAFITQQLQQGNMKLKHESNNLFGTMMITASTEELQRFVAKYGNDERIFSKTLTLKR